MADSKKAAKVSITLVLEKTDRLSYSRTLGRKIRHDRSNIFLKETAGKLTITIKAKDLTALRASANSILRDMQVIEATKNSK